MLSLLTSPVQPALPHALPFRLLLEEHRRRREVDLLANAGIVFAAMNPPPTGADTAAQLLKAICFQEDCYTALQDATNAISDGTRKEPLDPLIVACQAADAPLKRLLHLMDASAVCLSGGGIRSATFSLGILEGLARFSRPNSKSEPLSLMTKLDYLSTVSGGGYMGSWLMSWVYRCMTATTVPNGPGAYEEVLRGLAGHAAKTSGDPEPQAVRHLRSYTSYLAPALGLTLDTFTLFAIVLRNFVVNWAMLVPVLIAVISAVAFSGFFTAWANASWPEYFKVAVLSWHPHISGWHPHLFSWHPHVVLAITRGGIVIGLPFALAALAAGKSLPSHAMKGKRPSSKWVGLFLGGVIAGCWLVTVLAQKNPDDGVLSSKILISFLGFFLLGGGIFLTYRRRYLPTPADKAAMRAMTADQTAATTMNREPASPTRGGWAAAITPLLAACAMAVATGWLLYLLQEHVFHFLLTGDDKPWAQYLATEGRLYVVLALPLVIATIMLTTSLFCALVGLFEVEDDREWWVRCGGWLLQFMLAWVTAQALTLYGRNALYCLIAGACGLVMGLAGSYLGFSGATAATAHPVKTEQLSGVGKFLVKHSLVLPVVGGAAILLIALGMVTVEESLRNHLAMTRFGQTFCTFGEGRPEFLSALELFAYSGVVAVVMNLAININLFSLHGMYRMRLMRAFLGASNVFRHPDPFTKFDWKDTPHEAEMPCCNGVPMHLLNATLNLTGTKNPAWRQRKAEGFSFSPVACGGWRVGYVPTASYGGSKGLTLATAMAISGAAANPNMGYQSSPVLSLLMTFFNLRLGCWLPNPARPKPKLGIGERNAAFFTKSGPSFALWPLLAEAVELTDDTYRWVELTDGGHFEDLALYEMVLRRVKHVVLVDAGADPKFGFEDLGNAIRKIQIDLGVPIKFEPDLKMNEGAHAGNSYCAVATIGYECVDPILDAAHPQTTQGHLVYIKAGLNGVEPADILQYARTHKSFPHETTADQFFTESQFESYRHLGSYVVEKIVEGVTGVPTMEAFRKAAQSYWQKVT